MSIAQVTPVIFVCVHLTDSDIFEHSFDVIAQCLIVVRLDHKIFPCILLKNLNFKKDANATSTFIIGPIRINREIRVFALC